MTQHEGQEAELRNRIQVELILRLKLLDDRIHSIVDPAKVDPQILIAFFLQQQRILTYDHLQPSNQVAALDGYEAWYLQRQMPVPNQMWIINNRQYWQSRINDAE